MDKRVIEQCVTLTTRSIFCKINFFVGCELCTFKEIHL